MDKKTTGSVRFDDIFDSNSAIQTFFAQIPQKPAMINIVF